ncbi:UNVERIFIED_CONTAM: putative mitochondrial protein [Sesamum latifolium]|uniref:Mitochondrial protein n=1 Tax=Sesamum latifolium TaxID=2727402 RepID=A0AAW2XC85_9LAMI
MELPGVVRPLDSSKPGISYPGTSSLFDEVWLEDNAEIAQHISRYFGQVFSSIEPTISDWEHGVEALPCKVDSDMNSELLKPYTAEEVTNAISHMARLKSPGPNAFEINHFLRIKNWGKMRHMALKLDISNAYDKVEWSFLRQVLFKLRFHAHFVNLVILYVSSVSYSFILSGRQFGNIVPSRGIRQGDPLSPYLFLLYTEALGSLISQAEMIGQLKGICVSRNAPSIFHLLFVDDTILCCEASVEAMECIQSILQVYRKAFGQEINLQKSVVVFNKNTPELTMTNISAGLGIWRADRHDKYLGLPSVVGHTKKWFLIPSGIAFGNELARGVKNNCLKLAMRFL